MLYVGCSVAKEMHLYIRYLQRVAQYCQHSLRNLNMLVAWLHTVTTGVEEVMPDFSKGK
jgi:hypothetical protein